MKNSFIYFEEAYLTNGIPVLIEYSKNEEEGLVIAVAKDTEELAFMSCERALGGPIHLAIMPNSRLAKDLFMNNAYSGVARCFKGDETHQADEFNLEKGIEVARIKVMAKLESAILRRKKHLAKYVQDAAEMLVALY